MSSGQPASSNRNSGRKIVTDNRKARHDYHILETFEAGLVLVGTEVKSLRNGACTLSDAYVRVDDGNATIIGMHIPIYTAGNIHNHEPTRERRLLLNRREIDKIEEHITRKGCTAIPLSVYFTDGRAKLAVGIAKGKDKGDKRQAIAERDSKRELQREMKLRYR